MHYDKRPDPFYKSVAWRRLRREALERDHYICVDGMTAKLRGERIRPRTATVVHHIEPIEKRPDLRLELSNLVSLCDQCHNKRHPEKGGSGSREKAPEPCGVRIVKV